MSVIIRSAYSPKERLSFSCSTPSMTVQSEKDSCDINFIIRQYDRTGDLSGFTSSASDPEFIDVSGVRDFKESLDFVNDAQRVFDSLPAAVRKRFNGSPAAYLEFLNSSDNRSEAIDLGLIPPDPEPVAPIDVRVIDPSPIPE